MCPSAHCPQALEHCQGPLAPHPARGSPQDAGAAAVLTGTGRRAAGHAGRALTGPAAGYGSRTQLRVCGRGVGPGKCEHGGTKTYVQIRRSGGDRCIGVTDGTCAAGCSRCKPHKQGVALKEDRPSSEKWSASKNEALPPHPRLRS
eukprot:1144703-Pelagomonas_calceolata.AAC.3